MRSLYATLLLLIASFFVTSASMAQSSILACPSVDLTAPANGAVLDPGYRVNFTWDSQPRGTTTREWISVRANGDDAVSFDDAKRATAEARSYKGFARGTPGAYAWAVIFYDAKGNPICQSEARTFVVTGAGFASLSGESAAAVKAALGRYIIRLSSNDNTFYTGPANRQVASNNYNDDTDADNWKALGYTGLEIYGSQKKNTIKGSNLSDVIKGGDEFCDLACVIGDDIDGGDGDDYIEGGNETCNSACNLGDTIRGGKGKDTILGGNETCNVGACVVGDSIDGDDDDDAIYGGDENCAQACAAGDTIVGGDGADTINGGNEACGVACSAGDTITGNFAGNAEDGDKDTVNGQGGTDILSGTGADVLNQ